MPLTYDMPLFRPPSEGRSLILQVTLGCSWNRCSFCEMYQTKRFRVRPEDQIAAEADTVARQYPGVRRIFLADGNAFVLSPKRLHGILDILHARFPHLERVSAYAMPADILRKSDADLTALAERGLSMVYVGVESGDDEVLRRVDKGQTMAESVDSLQKAGAAGITRSVMILNGLGGRRFLEQHAENSAAVINATAPEFASSLVVSFPTGDARFRAAFGEGWEPPGQPDLFRELRLFLAACDTEGVEFRSNHASNYLVLKGELNRDRDAMLAQVDRAIHAPETAGLRPEWARGL